ncbi:MAG TPA: hypothetical protein VND19_11900 [Acetobacteraceae bacterium]|nr:hypothetical protein [Acetobacteraceae bacterium]
MRGGTLLIALSAMAMANPANAQPNGGGYGPGWMGPGTMGHGGFGPAAGGWGPRQQANRNLTIGQVKDTMRRWVAATGNQHIKLGAVAEKDADTITADVVTTDKDALVQRYDVNRHTGFTQPED